MSTPTKKRKTNSYKPSPKTVGSLDFFFGKKQEDQGSNKRDCHAPNEPNKNGDSHHRPMLGQEAQGLTDEELARKLQDEWDQQDNVHDSPEAPATKDVNEGPGRDGDVKEKNSEAVSSDEGQVPTSLRNGQDGQQDKGSHGEFSYEKKDTLSLQSTAVAEGTVTSTVPFDEIPLTFDPSKYLPDLRKQWAEIGGDASYSILIRCFVLVNSTQSRIKIVDTLVNFLRILIEGEPESLLPAVGLLSGTIVAILRKR